MIENLANNFIMISLVLVVLLSVWYFYTEYKHREWVQESLKVYDSEILQEDLDSKVQDFRLKLVQAGMSRSEFNQILFVSIIAGIAIFYLTFLFQSSFMIKIGAGIFALLLAIGMPIIYLQEQRSSRIKRINKDLAIFIDLMIIILEGGGGLNNAIDEVTIEGKGVLGNDLLEESKQFKYEMITYGSNIAYNNLAIRTASDAVGTIVGFMRLSEETGIGVKTIFENQSLEIKAEELLDIEKRASTMNISLTLTMFIFILPAVIAMMVFPMMADALMPKF